MDAAGLLAGLDDAQNRAVTTTANPLCILAGAGSGKTRVLTRRIAYRALAGDLDPRRVLALTFTRRAAGELATRLRAFELRDAPAAGTFHATAYAQLRASWAGADRRPPTLLDHKGRLLARLLAGSHRLSPGELGAEIEWAKARLVPPDRYGVEAHRAGRDVVVPTDRVADLYARYEDHKRTNSIVDFDDLLAQCADAMDNDPSFAAAQRWRFRHLFVDEYQDVNPLQQRLLRAWLGDRADLCVVGDPNQAIYRWNGADSSFLLRFRADHPDAEVVELGDNYRSTPQVLLAAAAVLAGEGGRPSPLRAHRAEGPIPQVMTYETDSGEANGIARALRDHHGPGVAWSGQAVLVRTNGQTTLIEAALRRARIPYRVRGGKAVLDEPDVREMLRGLAKVRAPFATTLSDLEASLPSTASTDADGIDPDDEVAGLVGRPPPDSAAGGRLAALETVVRLGRDFLLLDRHAPTSAFPAWLAANVRSDEPDRSGDAVTLATFHAAKGLEWPVVHLAGLEDGLAPITHARHDEALAEERRLMYVAMTRAQRELRLTWARLRTFGASEVARAPSPYLRQVLDVTERLTDAGSPVGDGVAPRRVADSRARLDAAGADLAAAADRAVLDALRTWREREARAAGVAPGVVLADRTLAAVAARRPADVDQLDRLPGLGPLKARRYGATLIDLVARHRVEGRED